jgi:hypothetical protein
LDELMLFPEKRRRRILVVAGLFAYFALLTVMTLSVLSSGPHLGFGEFRYRATWSDLGTLIMLLIAAPLVFWAAFVEWRRK